MSKKVHAHTHTHTQTHSLSGQTQLSEMTKKNGICNHCIIKEKLKAKKKKIKEHPNSQLNF